MNPCLEISWHTPNQWWKPIFDDIPWINTPAIDYKLLKNKPKEILQISWNDILPNTITANKLNVAALSDISPNIWAVTAGTITGATVQTASSWSRVVIAPSGAIETYDATNTKRVEMRNEKITLYTAGGVIAGFLYGNVAWQIGISTNLIIGWDLTAVNATISADCTVNNRLRIPVWTNRY